MPKKLFDELDDVKIRAAKPRAKGYKLNDGRNLILWVDPAGAKLWRLRFISGGKESMMSLGEYPDVSLKTARLRAGVARDQAKQGINPVQERREERARREAAARHTFQIIAEEWISKKQKKWTAGHTEQNQQSLRDFVYPKIGRRPITALGAPDVMQVLEPLEEAGKLETLRRVRQRISSVFAYAVQTGRRADNPVRDIKGAFDAPEREHFASVTPKALPAFLKALAAYQGHPSTIGIIRVILWTAARTGEIRGATWDEFDLKAGRWTIPAARMKRRRVHVVPLPHQAVELIEALKATSTDKLVFPSPVSPDQMASENIVLQAIDKMGLKGKLTGHGLRATVATALEELEYPVDVVKAQLSHAKSNLTDAAYLRGIHIERRTQMMQAWADHLDADTGHVIPIGRGKSKNAA